MEKLLVILDIDETLIHATEQPLSHDCHFRIFGYSIYERPFLREFLEELREHFEVAVWSSASDDYVAEIVKEIFPPEYPLAFTWGRTHCTYKPDYAKAEEAGYFDSLRHYDYVKNLQKVKKKFGYHPDRMLIVDDTPRKSMYNFGNAIYPSEFRGDPSDDELFWLIRYLKKLKEVPSVRAIEKRGWKLKIKNEEPDGTLS